MGKGEFVILDKNTNECVPGRLTGDDLVPDPW